MNKKLALEIKDNGIIKIDNFLNYEEILKIKKIVKYYSAPKNTPESYFPTNFNNLLVKILKLNFVKFFHSIEILKLSRKKNLIIWRMNFLEKKVSFPLSMHIIVKLASRMFYLGIQIKHTPEKKM